MTNNNLKHKLTVDELRKGGKNSGKTRRRQKSYKEIAKAVMSTKIENGDFLKIAAKYGIKTLDVKTVTLLGMINAAAAGSHNAFDRLLDLIGEKEQGENTDVIKKLDSVIGEVDKLAEQLNG